MKLSKMERMILKELKKEESFIGSYTILKKLGIKLTRENRLKIYTACIRLMHAGLTETMDLRKFSSNPNATTYKRHTWNKIRKNKKLEGGSIEP